MSIIEFRNAVDVIAGLGKIHVRLLQNQIRLGELHVEEFLQKRGFIEAHATAYKYYQKHGIEQLKQAVDFALKVAREVRLEKRVSVGEFIEFVDFLSEYPRELIIKLHDGVKTGGTEFDRYLELRNDKSPYQEAWLFISEYGKPSFQTCCSMSLQADATEKSDRILHLSNKMKLQESLMLDNFTKMVENSPSNPKGLINESDNLEVETEEISSNQNEMEQLYTSNSEVIEEVMEPRTEKKGRFKKLFSRKKWRVH
ncbi:hypothetical protein [Candidatus Borrarchaeum sp.]|uniref:hypothetical protein n=1 Tax=Candidatus Borrarchaeum sp. TaxID=2846742 RepID=UPI00257E03BD|nr:hypothetical protein [Candidatus Borrarchaeum sp.]